MQKKRRWMRSVFSTTAQPVIESNTVCRVGKRGFTYDVVIGPRTSQADVFKMTAKAVLNKVLAGFNGTVMAYGQTGSGKTYTMQGSTEQPGIIPRICANIFLAVQEDKTSEYNVKCSYVEIYNEMLHDLLTKEHTSPFIVEDPVRVSICCTWPCYANKGLGAVYALKLRYSFPLIYGTETTTFLSPLFSLAYKSPSAIINYYRASL